jgi:hypothetical protein
MEGNWWPFFRIQFARYKFLVVFPDISTTCLFQKGHIGYPFQYKVHSGYEQLS